MTVMLSPAPYLHFHDNDGRPLNGGFLWTYIAGTTTPLSTYRDATANTPNTNPIVLDFRGEASVWLDITRSYKFVLEDRTGALIWTQDNVFGGAAQSVIQEVIKTSDTTMANSNALITDPQLTFTLPVIGAYDIEIFLIFDAPLPSTTADQAGFQFTFGQSFSDTRGTIPVLIQGSVFGLLIGNMTTLENQFSFSQISNVPYGNIVLIKGSILAASTGTLTFNWAQLTPSASTTLRAGSYMKATLIRSSVPAAGALQRVYASYTPAGLELIPANYNQLVVEVWGAGGGGGGALVAPSGASVPGGGGGSGGYCRFTTTVTGYGGQTLNFSVGLGGANAMNSPSAQLQANGGQAGGASQVSPTSPGTIPFTALTANGGQGGGGAGSAIPGVPGQGGQNSTGGDVQMPGNAGNGILGGLPVPGINAGGTAGGNGGGVVNGVVTIAQQGQDGKVVFTYTV